MAATVYAEHNQVKWVGVRPGVEGEQIVKSGEQANGTNVLYTVPAGKVLLIFQTYVTGIATAASGGRAQLRHTTDVPATIYMFGNVLTNADNGGTSIVLARFVPYECLAGTLISLYSSVAAIIAGGGFEGILIDA